MTYRYRITIIFLIGFFIDCINIFMSAIALPEISNSFHISQSATAWVANSYIFGLILIIPLSRWFAHYLGPKATLTLSMLGFSLSACGVGLSSNFLTLVLGRFLQGIFGGLLIPVGQALAFNLFAKNERAKVSSMIMSIALIAPALSPVLGGLIIDFTSWRWIFLSHIPFSLLTVILVLTWMKNEKTIAQPPDFKGIFLISGTLINLLIAISMDLSIQYIGLSLMLSVIFMMLYYKHSQSTPTCVIDLTLLKSSKMSLSVMIYYLIPGVFNGVNLISIFLLQDVMHWHASTTGLLMVLYGIGCACSIRYCAFNYNRIGYQRLFKSAIIFHVIGVLCLCIAPLFNIFLFTAYILMGIGGGLGANTAQTTAMIDFTDHQLQQASLLWNLNRQISFCVMPTVLLFILKLLKIYFPIVPSYQILFFISAMIGLLPLVLQKINNEPNPS